MPPIHKERSGQTIGRLLLLCVDKSQPLKNGKYRYRTRCYCGLEFVTSLQSILNGDTKSCGTCGSHAIPPTKHGMYKTPEYTAWHNMKGRCLDPNRKGFQHYGGRGISICERWLHSFDNFFADVGPKPTPKHSLDRYPNSDGNYEPDNVRWATRKEQANNQRHHLCDEKTRAKIRATLKCRRELIPDPRIGRKLSEVTKAKMRAARARYFQRIQAIHS